MKVSELLKVIDSETIIVFSHLDAQNIGYKFIASDVPHDIDNMTVCEISADNNQLDVVVCYI